MISERPAFYEGEHFRINRKGKPRWRYTTLKTIRLKIESCSSDTISFRDRNGIEWMRLAPTICGKTQITIASGYSWDGMTMALDLQNYLEPLVHDVLYQFRHTEHFPFSRRECDDAFLDLMKLGGFGLGIVYWRAVRLFGGCFKSQNGEWSKILTTHAIG